MQVEDVYTCLREMISIIINNNEFNMYNIILAHYLYYNYHKVL